MINKKLYLMLAILTGIAFPHAVFAEMTLDNTASKISFVSIKKNVAGEIHTFDSVSGTLSDTGELTISIDLSSVNTNIEIRDERMNEHLFEIVNFPKATLSAQVGDTPGNGEIGNITTEAMLDLHGIKKSVKVDAIAMRSEGKLLVTSLTPILINVADYKLEAGVEKLREIASLPSIATAVPVNFVLVFKP